MPEYPLVDLTAQRPDRGHYVYRFYDTGSVLLYVGSSGDLWRRFSGHVIEHAEWWPEVDWDRTLVLLISPVQCGSKCRLPEHAEMLAEEKRLLLAVRPRYNLRSTGYCRKGIHLLSEHGRVQLNGHVGCYTCQLERQAATYDAAKKKAQRLRQRARKESSRDLVAASQSPQCAVLPWSGALRLIQEKHEMAASDTSEEPRAWMRAEIDAQCFGEDFGFEVIPHAQVTPQGAVMQYVFVISMRAPLLGQPPLMHIATAQSPRPARDDVKKIVTQALQGLRALSAQLLATGNGAGA